MLSSDSHDYLQKLLIKHEGFRQFPYVCTAGRLTIGIGRNIQDRGLSLDEAMYLLNNDIKQCEQELTQYLPEYANLCEMRKIVLIDMCFNLGISGLMQFRDMIAAIRVADYETAAKAMRDSKWAEQVGNRAHELAYLMEKGNK